MNGPGTPTAPKSGYEASDLKINAICRRTHESLFLAVGLAGVAAFALCTTISLGVACFTAFFVLLFAKETIQVAVVRWAVARDAKRDPREFILLLRSFHDRRLSEEHVNILNYTITEETPVGSGVYLPVEKSKVLRVSYVASLAKALLGLGRVVIIGSHHSLIEADCHALQLASTDVDWKSAFHLFAGNARAIVMIYGETPSVHIELSTCLELEAYRDKFYLFVAPQPKASNFFLTDTSFVSHDPDALATTVTSRASAINRLEAVVGIVGIEEQFQNQCGFLHVSTGVAILCGASFSDDCIAAKFRSELERVAVRTVPLNETLLEWGCLVKAGVG